MALYLPILFFVSALGVGVGSYFKITFMRFTALYIFLAIIASFIQWLIFDLTALLLTLGVSALSAILVITLIGLLGGKFRLSSYMIALSALGLFPWFINPMASYVYLGVVLASVLFAFLIDNMRKRNLKTKAEIKPRFIIGLPIVLAALAVILFIL